MFTSAATRCTQYRVYDKSALGRRGDPCGRPRHSGPVGQPDGASPSPAIRSPTICRAPLKIGCTTNLWRVVGATLAVARAIRAPSASGTGQARPLRFVPPRRRRGDPCGRPPNPPLPPRRDGTSPSPAIRSPTICRAPLKIGCTTNLWRVVGATLAVARAIRAPSASGTGQARPLRFVPPRRRRGDPCGRPPNLPLTPRRDGASPSPTIRSTTICRASLNILPIESLTTTMLSCAPRDAKGRPGSAFRDARRGPRKLYEQRVIERLTPRSA